MFVSKKKYDEQYAIWQAVWLEKHEELRAARNELAAIRGELSRLRASRARSNENLKLGTAASAKARRGRKDGGKNFNGILAVKGDVELALYDEQDHENEFWPRKANSDLGMFYIFHDRSEISFGTAGDGWTMKHVL